MYRSHVLVCGGTGCTSSGSVQILKALQDEIDKNGLSSEVQVVKTGCFGLCALGPIMIVYPEEVSTQWLRLKIFLKLFQSIFLKEELLRDCYILKQ